MEVDQGCREERCENSASQKQGESWCGTRTDGRGCNDPSGQEGHSSPGWGPRAVARRPVLGPPRAHIHARALPRPLLYAFRRFRGPPLCRFHIRSRVVPHPFQISPRVGRQRTRRDHGRPQDARNHHRPAGRCPEEKGEVDVRHETGLPDRPPTVLGRFPNLWTTRAAPRLSTENLSSPLPEPSPPRAPPNVSAQEASARRRK